jgi:hypothetical protein
MIYGNLSQMAREIDAMGKAIFKDVGDAIAYGIWEEFRILVQETAQWTGTTAASWNLYMQGRVGPIGVTGYREMPKRTRKEALQRGHGDAVQIALAANYDNLLDITTQYRYAEIVISNYAPGADRAESGPLRAVNQPTQAFERFKSRVAFRNFDVIRDRKL